MKRTGVHVRAVAKKLLGLAKEADGTISWLPLADGEKTGKLRVYDDNATNRPLKTLTEKAIRGFLWDLRNSDRSLRDDAAVWIYSVGDDVVAGLGVVLDETEVTPPHLVDPEA